MQMLPMLMRWMRMRRMRMRMRRRVRRMRMRISAAAQGMRRAAQRLQGRVSGREESSRLPDEAIRAMRMSHLPAKQRRAYMRALFNAIDDALQGEPSLTVTRGFELALERRYELNLTGHAARKRRAESESGESCRRSSSSSTTSSLSSSEVEVKQKKKRQKKKQSSPAAQKKAASTKKSASKVPAARGPRLPRPAASRPEPAAPGCGAQEVCFRWAKKKYKGWGSGCPGCSRRHDFKNDAEKKGVIANLRK